MPTTSATRSRRSTRSPTSSTTCENRLGQLDEDYGAAQDRRTELDQDIAAAQAKIAEQQAELDQLAGRARQIAVDKYVSGEHARAEPAVLRRRGLQRGRAARLAQPPGDRQRRRQHRRGAGPGRRARQGARRRCRPQAEAGRRPRRHAERQAGPKARRCRPSTSRATRRRRPSSATSRRAGARAPRRSAQPPPRSAPPAAGRGRSAAAPPRRRADQRSAASAAPRRRWRRQRSAASDVAVGSATPAPARCRRRRRAGGTAAPSAPPPSSSRPASPSTRPMGQLGVPYRFAAESPGVAFDCSGLTKYAWGQAGVYLPHQSARSTRSTPHVSAGRDPARRPDLLQLADRPRRASTSVAGMMIHAPRTGDVVRSPRSTGPRSSASAGPAEPPSLRCSPRLCTGIDIERGQSRWLAANIDGVSRAVHVRAHRRRPLEPHLPRSPTPTGDAFVLRRPPLGHVLATAHDMAREHRIIAAVGTHRRARAAGARPVHRRRRSTARRST